MHIDPTAYYDHSLTAALSGNYVVYGDMAAADCCIAAAFGARNDGVIGLSNQALATFLETLPRQLPRIVQGEVFEASSQEWRGYMQVIDHSRNPAQRLDTLEFLEQAAAYMQAHSLQRAVLVGHPNHIPWLDFLCEQIGIATVVPNGLAEVPFDPQSSQAWTRSLAAWQAEVLARQQAGNERQALS